MRRDFIKFVDATEEHIELIYNWRNQPFIREVMYNSDFIKWEDHVNWLRSVFQDEMKFIKVLYYKDVPYGIANFHLTNKVSGFGEWGFYIGDKNAPRGMGKVLAYSMLNFLFEEVKIRKVCADVLDFNRVSLNFHEKVGFKQDGILREHIYKNSRYCDVHLFSIFEEEWMNRKKFLEKELFN